MNKYLIGCVVPTLNSAETLETTLLSLKAQRHVGVEIIVADSGSSDGTLGICERFGVPVVYVEPGNMYRAINAGLAQFQTAWLAYLNSDDWLYPDSFAKLIEIGNSASADVVYGNCDYADGMGRFLYSFTSATPDQLTPLFRLGRMGFAQPSAIFRRALCQTLAGFDESYYSKGDADFFIRALNLRAKFAFLDGPAVCSFRLLPNRLSIRIRQVDGEEGKRLLNGPGMKPRASDSMVLVKWRLRNLPNYLIRFMRERFLDYSSKTTL